MTEMPLSQKELFIFDLDGTLIDAYRAIHKSLNYTRRRLGYVTVSFEEAKHSVGHGDRRFIAHFFSAKDRSKALRLYRRRHAEDLKDYARLLPYGRQLLVRLRKKGKKVAVASNRPSRFSRVILRSTGVLRLFDYVLCADQIRSLKPSPKIVRVIMRKFSMLPERTVFVGDMSVDVETAYRAGVDSVFITGGSSFLKEARQYPIRKVIHSLRELSDLIK